MPTGLVTRWGKYAQNKQWYSTLREKNLNLSFSLSVFSRIWTENGYLLDKSLYIQSGCGKIQTTKNSELSHFSRRANLQYFL